MTLPVCILWPPDAPPPPTPALISDPKPQAKEMRKSGNGEGEAWGEGRPPIPPVSESYPSHLPRAGSRR